MAAKSRNTKRDIDLTGEWATPPELFNQLDQKYHFTLDPCARSFNAKCKKYFTPKQDGLLQNWAGETVFCCPPSGRKNLKLWAKKCREESLKPDTTVVALLPTSMDSQWFHQNIYRQNGVTIEFLPSRVSFYNAAVPSWKNNGTQKNGRSNRPSMIVIMHGDKTPFAVR